MPHGRTWMACRRTATILLATAGLARPTLAQGDPLRAPFPDSTDLESLLSGDGTLGFVLRGERASMYTGHAIAGAGDVNADGIQDLLIGTSEIRPGETPLGVAYIVFGRASASGPAFPALVDLASLPAGWGVRVEGTQQWPGMGRSVAAAGDVNGDGIDDVIIGATGERRDEAEGLGAAFVIFGRDASGPDPLPATITPDDIDGTNGVRLEGWQVLDPSSSSIFRYSQAGWSVAGLGDINGDGADDVAVGTRGGPTTEDRGLGTVCVVFGRPSAAGASFGWRLALSSLNGRIGFRIVGAGGRAVAGAGDVNGDGFGDVLVGHPGALPERYCYTTYGCGWYGSGRAYVLFGRDNATEPFEALLPLEDIAGDRGLQLDSGKFDARVGTAVAAAGDVNGDGLDDLLVGAPGTARSSYYTRPWYDHGEAYVVFGRDHAGPDPYGERVDLSMLDGTNGFAIRGRYALGSCGQSLAAGGDLNNDGVADLLVAEPGSDFFIDGSAAAIYGRAAPTGAMFPAALDYSLMDLSDGVGALFLDRDDNGAAGRGLTGIGDFNGDGVDDFAIGAPGVDAPGRQRAGETYVIFGRNPSHPCRPDLDGDDRLTVFDFLAFQNLFDAGDPAADFDGDGVLTVFDFLAFQNAFDAGCP